MRNPLLLFAAFLVCSSQLSFAQVIGTNCFLQGTWLEIGMQGNGSFGTSSSPTTYHSHPYSGSTSGVQLAEVYDYGHDGWTTGTPPFMGDYTYPGSPFEGWEIQMNGVSQAQGFQGYGTGFGYAGGASMAVSPLTYSSAGGQYIGNLLGTFTAGTQNLVFKQETRVDQRASWVTVTTKFYNTSTTVACTDVFYLRSCDPDNDESWPGGSFTTNNMVNYQIPNPDNRVEVTATGRSSTLPPLSLATKDCRAVAFIYQCWPLGIGTDLNLLWTRTTSTACGSYFDVGVNHLGDIGIGLVYKLGTILPGDSTVISYSYVFNGVNGIDSAHPDPELSINNIPVTTFPDTLNGCLFPGVDSLPVNIIFGNDKDWTWGKWTWSPSVGLSSTTGVNNYIHLDEVPGTYTYTVTGTDTSAGSMTDCNVKTFIFTVHSCHLAYVNSPCFGDALDFGMLGDSIGATYVWYGPGGYVSGVHDPVRYPSSWSDTGNYTVVRTIAGVTDTDHVHVVIHPTPPLTLASNIALCGRLADTLLLTVSPDSIGETFAWTGPNGFASTSAFPTITPFDSTGTGTYTVHATTQYGCTNTASINVYPGVDPNFSFVIHRGCTADTVYFTNLSTDANVYSWNFGDGTGGDTSRNIVHIYTIQNQLYNVELTASNAHCSANITLPVDIRHEVHAIFAPTPDTLCFGQATQLVNTSYASVDAVTPATATFGLQHYTWYLGDGTSYTLDTAFSPIYTYAAPGIYPAQLVVKDSIGCIDSVTHNVYVLLVGVSGFGDTTLCISQPLPLHNVVTLTPNIDVAGWVYQWSPAANLNDTTVQIPMFNAIGSYTYTDLVTLMPWGCTASYTVTVNSILGKVLSDVTASATIALGASIQLNADSEILYYWKPNDGSLNNDNINDPIATPGATTTYTVFGYDVNGCLDSAYVTIYVDSTMLEDMPTGFTPDGDGLNDVFKPVGPMFSRMLEMRVYSRWGEELFFSNDKNHGWDGTFHGVPQDIGVYYYQIIVATADGGNKVYKGSVTLIR